MAKVQRRRRADGGVSHRVLWVLGGGRPTPGARAGEHAIMLERAITGLVARGYGTDDIADRLYLSVRAVRDHRKSISDKVGVRTRGELIARLFLEYRAPRLSDHARPMVCPSF